MFMNNGCGTKTEKKKVKRKKNVQAVYAAVITIS